MIKTVGTIKLDPLGRLFIDITKAHNMVELDNFLQSLGVNKLVAVTVCTQEQALLEEQKKKALTELAMKTTSPAVTPGSSWSPGSTADTKLLSDVKPTTTATKAEKGKVKK